MNIAELLHNSTEGETISHWPVFTINEERKSWYFYSCKGMTLRKKIQNTTITGFLASGGEGQEEGTTIILEVREVDRRQPRSGQLYTIKVNKLKLQTIQQASPKTQQSILLTNSWQHSPNSQTTLYKIQNPHKNKLESLQWSPNILTCKAPLNSFQREKLACYGELLGRKVEEKMLKGRGRVRRFQLVFTYCEDDARVRVVFAQNFVFGDGEAMYQTDLRLGGDQFQELELLLREQGKMENKQNLMQPVQAQPQFNQSAQQKRLQYIKLLQKLSEQQTLNPLRMALKKSTPPVKPPEEYQCSCCNSYVVLSEFEPKKMITSNRIPQLQIARQVKMRAGTGLGVGGLGDYELVAVCGLCYEKWREIVDARERDQGEDKEKEKEKVERRRVQSVKPKQNSFRSDKEVGKTGPVSTSVHRQKKREHYLKANYLRSEQQNTTKTNNTTTIRQDIHNSLQENSKLGYYLDSIKPVTSQKPRKASLHLQDIQVQGPAGQRTLNPRIARNQTFHHRIAKMQRQPEKMLNLEPDFDTDDELTCAVVEYEQSTRFNKNRQKIRNLRNLNRFRKKPL